SGGREGWEKAQRGRGGEWGRGARNLDVARADMGGSMGPEAIEALTSQCVMNPDVQVVVSEGLSTDAITANYEEILPPFLAGLKQAGLNVGTPFFVRSGRVRVQEQIGDILGVKVALLRVANGQVAG
ncbi:ethanolamine ammonia-lyase light chain EutC, partial [Salmonella enterica]|uniref:ethanolamine ammonia-lyase light chain EutC n=1 Tax=Salmonella enterica TaxID=28901 RepID=UPI00398C7B08